MSKYSYLADIKPEAARPPTREEIDGAREWYVHGFTVSRIVARWNMSLGTLYYWLDGGPVVGEEPDAAALANAATPLPNPPPQGGRESSGKRLLPPIPRRKQVLGKRRRALKGDRVSLTARLWRTTERQVRDIEERLSRPSASSPERERDVRMLASLVRALRDLSAFEKAGEAAAEQAPTTGAAFPPEHDIEALRASVMRKLQNIVDRREAGSKSSAESGT